MACTDQDKQLIQAYLDNMVGNAISAIRQVFADYDPYIHKFEGKVVNNELQYTITDRQTGNQLDWRILGQTEKSYMSGLFIDTILSTVLNDVGNVRFIEKVAECLQACPTLEPTPDPECYACNTDLVNKLRTLLNDVRFVLKA